MVRARQPLYKLSIVISMVLITLLLPNPTPAQADWPPFEFTLTPTYDSGKITYSLRFSTDVEWLMTNLVIKIPLPKGTRFLETRAQPGTEASFDGAEVTFFTAALYRQSIRDATFVVEPIDSTQEVFTTHAWIAWQGDQPGDYLTGETSINVSKPSLNWNVPPQSRLQLGFSAITVGNVATYTIYPQNIGGLRMWDLKISVSIPEGTTFLSAEAPADFTSSVNNQEVSFFTVELERGSEFAPLTFKVSTVGVTVPLLVTHAWATWKNVGSSVGKTVAPQEQTRTGDLILQPGRVQWVVQDPIGDVPLPNYDVMSVAFQPEETALKVIFYLAGQADPASTDHNYILYIDEDCKTDTGLWRIGRGVEYQVRSNRGRSTFDRWDEATQTWQTVELLTMQVKDQTVNIWLPYALLKSEQQFCWIGWGRNKSRAYNQTLPAEQIPNRKDLAITKYNTVVFENKVNSSTKPIESVSVKATPIPPTTGIFIEKGDTWRYLPGWLEPPPTWRDLDFEARDWYSGQTSIGYGPAKYATDLSQIISPIPVDSTLLLVQRTITQSGVIVAELQSGETASVFMRRTFTLDNLSLLTRLKLNIDFEGGFVAYLNGSEIARRGIGEPGSPVPYNALAVTQQDSTFEEINLTRYLDKLLVGTNVLAIEIHRSANSSTLSVNPQLMWEYNPSDIVVEPVSSNDSLVEPVVTPTPLPITPIGGNLAIPIDNGHGVYDVHIFSLPLGKKILQIPNARQPNFRFDGQRLLINREGGGAENLYEYKLADATQEQVSDAPKDSQPFYDSYGNRVVYANPELTYGKPEPVYDNDENKWYYTGVPKPFIFVQCGLLPPHREQEPRCRDIATLGVLVPAGQMSEIQGTHPVWTSNDTIVYKGCNSWAGFGLCGIYSVPAVSTKGFSDGFIPQQLTRESTDTPSDTKGNFIVFTSYRDNNWEAYIMDLNGGGVTNLSRSPESNDGLPTISPDRNWVAFVSDRDGRWAIWATPTSGGTQTKLFDLPVDTPWGNQDRDWTNERISWGP